MNDEFYIESIKILRNASKGLILIYLASAILIFSAFQKTRSELALEEAIALKSVASGSSIFFNQNYFVHDSSIYINQHFPSLLFNDLKLNSSISYQFRDSISKEILSTIPIYFKKNGDDENERRLRNDELKIYSIDLPFLFENAPNIGDESIQNWVDFLSSNSKLTLFKPRIDSFNKEVNNHKTLVDSIIIDETLYDYSLKCDLINYGLDCYFRIDNPLNNSGYSELEQLRFKSFGVDTVNIIFDFKSYFEAIKRSKKLANSWTYFLKLRYNNGLYQIEDNLDLNSLNQLVFNDKILSNLSSYTNVIDTLNFDMAIENLSKIDERKKEISLFGFDVSVIFLVEFFPIMVFIIFIYKFFHLKPMVKKRMKKGIYPWFFLYKSKWNDTIRAIFYILYPLIVSTTLIVDFSEYINSTIGGIVLLIVIANVILGYLINQSIKKVELEIEF